MGHLDGIRVLDLSRLLPGPFLTMILADLGLDISLAKVSTEGEKVADAFYVHRGGQPITDAAERELLTTRLRQALEAPGLTGS